MIKHKIKHINRNQQNYWQHNLKYTLLNNIDISYVVISGKRFETASN